MRREWIIRVQGFATVESHRSIVRAFWGGSLTLLGYRRSCSDCRLMPCHAKVVAISQHRVPDFAFNQILRSCLMQNATEPMQDGFSAWQSVLRYRVYVSVS